MANFLFPHLLTISFLISLLTISTTGAGADDYSYIKSLNPKSLKLRKEKLSHFRFYWHDIYSGKKPTAVPIIQSPTNGSLSGFGQVTMIDDPLTETPELRSKLIGRAQGFYGSACQEEVGLLMAMNFAFKEGKYNGSTLTVLGRNPVFNKVREMPVIGGSGLFRFARGYVHASTHSFDLKTGDAVVEYNVYVLHY